MIKIIKDDKDNKNNKAVNNNIIKDNFVNYVYKLYNK